MSQASLLQGGAGAQNSFGRGKTVGGCGFERRSDKAAEQFSFSELHRLGTSLYDDGRIWQEKGKTVLSSERTKGLIFPIPQNQEKER